jgi:transposase-like protein
MKNNKTKKICPYCGSFKIETVKFYRCINKNVELKQINICDDCGESITF